MIRAPGACRQGISPKYVWCPRNSGVAGAHSVTCVRAPAGLLPPSGRKDNFTAFGALSTNPAEGPRPLAATGHPRGASQADAHLACGLAGSYPRNPAPRNACGPLSKPVSLPAFAGRISFVSLQDRSRLGVCRQTEVLPVDDVGVPRRPLSRVQTELVIPARRVRATFLDAHRLDGRPVGELHRGHAALLCSEPGPAHPTDNPPDTGHFNAGLYR